MNIAFYADHHYWGQLANCGGTRTILLSAKTLNEMGHPTGVVAHKDRFTWFKHPAPAHKVPKGTDAIVAAGICDVGEVLAGHMTGRYNVKRIAYWARPYETWQMDEDTIRVLLHRFVKHDGIVLVNSDWQRRELATFAIPSTVVYAGLDFDQWTDVRGPWEKPLYIGCQYSSKSRKRWSEFEKLHAALGDDDYRYVAFGSEKCKVKWLEKYLHNPSHDDLNHLYGAMHIFLCPNKLEGFYNCGAEAALCGCLLVVSARQRNGLGDYANVNTAHIYDTVEGACHAIENPDPTKIDKMQHHLRDHIGTREVNMQRLVEALA